MQANKCRLKIFRDVNPKRVETLFAEWAVSLPDTCLIKGQPSIEFSPAQAQFVVVCMYATLSPEKSAKKTSKK